MQESKANYARPINIANLSRRKLNLKNDKKSRAYP